MNVALGGPIDEPGVGAWEWRVALHPAGWEALAGEWNALSSSLSPLADATWACCLAGAFYRLERTPVAVHALYSGGRLRAVLPLERRPGLSRVWASLDNEHTPYWLFPSLDPTPGQARAILDHLLSDADYIFFRRLHLDGPMCRFLVEASRAAGLRTSLIQSEEGDTILPLRRPWEDFRASLPKNILQDTPRKLRNLQKQGELRLEMVTEPSRLDAALTECFALEAKGWKGATGSPMRAHPATHRFYTELARQMSARGRFTLVLLRLDERIIAFEYWLRGSSHIEMLKISFDPEFSKLSPGGVLRYLALKHEIETGDSTSYHLGRPSDWKLRWTRVVQPLCTLRVYARTVKGSLAFLAGPALRGTLKRYRPLQTMWRAFERRFLSD